MRTVYINGRFLIQPMSGVQRYAREILNALDKQAATSPLKWVILAPQKSIFPTLSNIKCCHVGPLNGPAWDQLIFATRSRKGVALSLGPSGPLFHPRHLIVLHDASVARYPEHFSAKYRVYHQITDHIHSRNANIATVSEFSKQELSAVLGIDESAITVASNGAEHVQRTTDRSVISRLGLVDQRYFVTLGNHSSNKNLAVVMRALELMGNHSPKLVAIGSVSASIFGKQQITPTASAIFPGRISDADVSALMQGATAFIFPSIYEGFGIPLLEAMANDCPVIASNIPSSLEVAANAAEYFDAQDERALMSLMQIALDDDGAWRARLVQAGKERVARYTWTDSAARLSKVCSMLAQS